MLASILSVLTISVVAMTSIAIHQLHDVMVDNSIGGIETITWFRAALSFGVISLAFSLVGLNQWTKVSMKRIMGTVGLLISFFLMSWSVIGFLMCRGLDGPIQGLLIGTSVIFLLIVVLAMTKSILHLRWRHDANRSVW